MGEEGLAKQLSAWEKYCVKAADTIIIQARTVHVLQHCTGILVLVRLSHAFSPLTLQTYQGKGKILLKLSSESQLYLFN
jgi:hypothetical protein